jgi:hypothetical protein
VHDHAVGVGQAGLHVGAKEPRVDDGDSARRNVRERARQIVRLADVVLCRGIGVRVAVGVRVAAGARVPAGIRIASRRVADGSRGGAAPCGGDRQEEQEGADTLVRVPHRRSEYPLSSHRTASPVSHLCARWACGIIALLVTYMAAPAAARAEERFAVAGPATRLFAAPSQRADSFRHADLSTSQPRRFVVRVVEDRGAWLEVQTLDGATARAHACSADAPDLFEEVELRLFVRRADLLPVVTRPVANDFPDGTSLRLSPGLPLGSPGAGGTPVLDVLETRVVLPPDAVGVVYSGAMRDPPPPRDWWLLSFYAIPQVRFAGGGSVELAPGTLGVAVERSGAPVDREGRIAASFASRCGTYVVRVPARLLTRPQHAGASDSSDGTAMGFGGLMPDRVWTIAAGTPLVRANGASLGRTRLPITFEERGPRGRPAHKCFRLASLPDHRQTTGLVVCAATDRVAVERLGGVPVGPGGGLQRFGGGLSGRARPTPAPAAPR